MQDCQNNSFGKNIANNFLNLPMIATYRQEDIGMDKKKTTGKLLTKLHKHNGWGCSHSVRVSYYAVEIGRYLGLDEDRIDELFTAALLHDIGKLFIPARLLDKTSVLTKAEYHLIKGHIWFGYLLLKVLGYSREICKAVWNHHERYDGKGYRKKKKTELLAKIICVADAYDAMKCSRPYREGMDSAEIYCAMETGSGKQFDPAVWQAMTHLLFPENCGEDRG